MKHAPAILLTIDVEECDIPLEYGYSLDLEEQLEQSRKGLQEFMSVISQTQVPCTIFCTGVYAQHNPEWIKALDAQYELASHGFYHSKFDPKTDLLSSRVLLEELSGRKVVGFRMARMQHVEEADILQAGYSYHSSLNPTWIPGRYNHLKASKLPFFEQGLWNIPASVTPNFRIPLFWLAFKNFPLFVYKQMCKETLKKHGFLNLYFHPWEFADLSKYPLPAHVSRGSQGELVSKLKSLILYLQKEGLGEFMTMGNFVKQLENGK
ncbi:DUF3473 domain-containing protein [Cytophagaceae bacterium 50C-KIRBA]|uniref:DUF3473 domain-containing protein n=1 Tax=Aquirufa beregesia TaxID=2516556 RepID=A0ABX0F4S7_9BACT|nr:DUF3473 domain-containing protein [Aquirufa beregesia]NGZ44865.1 DUF3473 domain-containing protein [Aquirufa beregesia]